MGAAPRLVQEYSALELDELLEITSYEQLTARPRFDPRIDSVTVKPVQIIGFYPGLSNPIQCGRSECQRWQRKGYLVVCSDGTETNIGAECGENILGVSWDDLRSSANSKWTQKQTLEAVRRGSARAGEYLKRLDDLVAQPLGARWLIETGKAFEEATPREVVSSLRVRAGRSETEVRVLRRRTDSELAIYDSTHEPDTKDDRELERYRNRRERLFVDDVAGKLTGLDMFNFDGRTAIFAQLKPRLQSLQALSADAMSWKERREWEQWLRDVETRLLEVERWVQTGVDFFRNEKNFTLLVHLANDRDAKRQVEFRTWSFPDGGWRPVPRQSNS